MPATIREVKNAPLWTPSHGRACVGRIARIFLQQLFKHTECSWEDLLDTMNDRNWGRKSQKNP